MSEDLIFGLRVTLMGCIVVFTALVIIWQIMEAFRKLEHPESSQSSKKKHGEHQHSEPSQEAALSSEAEVEVPKVEPQISPEVVAAISAAIACVIDKKYRIKHIRYRATPPENAWNKQGISSIMSSHSPKRHHGR